MVRAISNRILPLVGRYGSVLLAALFVFCLIREPLSVMLGKDTSAHHPQLGKGYLRVKEHPTDNLGDPFVANEVGSPGPPRAPVPGPPKAPIPGPPKAPRRGPAAAAQGVRDQNALIPPLEEDATTHKKVYKPEPLRYPLVLDHFPWLTHSRTAPPVRPNNFPPSPHVDEQTPLFIGFTRNWPLLLQCLSSYVAAGWPPGDIYVVENTGTFRSNRQQDLSLQNPFFLNYTTLHQLGVNVITTPTLLTFAQLQNFFLHTALQRAWPFFFWSHQDVIVFSDEDVKKKDRDHDWDHDPYATIYERCVGLLRYLQGPDMPRWSTHFFKYDHLALVNRDAYLEVGAWDTHIPYYAADCDMYLRLHWAGYWQPQSEAGLIYDVAIPLNDIGALFRFPGSHAAFQGDPVFARPLNPSSPSRPGREAELQRELDMHRWVEKEGESYTHLIEVAERMQELKWAGKGVNRNSWQARQDGGHGEPFFQDPAGFSQGLETIIAAGRTVFADKWGHRGCDLIKMGVEGGDAWKLERDWDIKLSPGSEGGNWGMDWMTGSELD